MLKPHLSPVVLGMVYALQHGDFDCAISLIEDSLLELKTGFMQRNHGAADSSIDIAGRVMPLSSLPSAYLCRRTFNDLLIAINALNIGLLNDLGSYCLLEGTHGLGYKHLQRAMKCVQSSYAGDHHLLYSVWGNLLVHHTLTQNSAQGLALGGEILRSINPLPVIPPRPPISRSPQLYGKLFIPYSLDQDTLTYGHTHSLAPYMLYPRITSNYFLPIWRVCNLYMNIAYGGTKGLGEGLVVVNEGYGVLCGVTPASPPLLIPMACTLLLDTALFILQSPE
ncbi:hypothetical protein EON65_19935, partial [archaeon]